MSVSVASALAGSSASAATPAAIRVDPVSTAMVEVVLTDSVREPPIRAYTSIGTRHVYRPTCTGSPAMVA